MFHIITRNHSLSYFQKSPIYMFFSLLPKEPHLHACHSLNSQSSHHLPFPHLLQPRMTYKLRSKSLFEKLMLLSTKTEVLLTNSNLEKSLVITSNDDHFSDWSLFTSTMSILLYLEIIVSLIRFPWITVLLWIWVCLKILILQSKTPIPDVVFW